jgi:hypothetical protein
MSEEKKSLILVAHKTYKGRFSESVVEIIEPRDGNVVSLEMLSDALFRIVPGNSEFGLSELRVGCEDAYSVVLFLSFDH